MIVNSRAARVALAIFSLTAAGTLRAQNAPPQQSQPTFRSSADFVRVAVQARDRNGRPVNDLRLDELQLVEDAKPQQIASFELVNTPIERRPVTYAEKGAVAIGETARATNAAVLDGRTFVFFVDAMHIAAERTVPMRRLLKQFIVDNMGDNDVAAVVVTGGLTPSQDFTGDKGTLLAAINRITGDRLPTRMFSKWHHKMMLSYDYLTDEYAGERAHRAQQSLISLRRVVQMLAGVGGKRTAVLYVSEGLDVDMNDRIGKAGGPHQASAQAGRDPKDDWSNTTIEANYAGQVADEMQVTVEASTRANVAIYTIDPRGLTDGEENNIQIAGAEQPGGFLPTSLFRAESVRMQQNLRDLAGRTGGRAIVGTNNFTDPFAAIMDDASTYYVLSYGMTHRDDGKFHRVAVRTSRPGVTLTARDGYYSPRAGAAARVARSPLATLLESPIQLPGLTMSAASTVIPRAGASAVRFAVEFNGAAVSAAAGAPPVIELAYVLVDDEGKVLSRGEKTLTLAVSKDMRASLADHGLRYVADLAAPPGKHHLRLAAENQSTMALGSLFWDVDVPVIPPSGVAVSPLVLASAQADAMPTISDVSRDAAVVEGLMTAQREFTSADVLSMSALVANPAKTRESLTGSFVISTEGGQEVARRDSPLPTANPNTAMALFQQRVSLDTLEPGRYRADFVVKSAKGELRARRAVEFSVHGPGSGS